MSSQKGNTTRTRPQKHKNKTAFKNNLHDTSQRTKFINNIQVSEVCGRCKEIIEWKIKYKKYKPLTQPKKCVKCEQKTVKQAYHVMCSDCGKKHKVCTKCCQEKEIIQAPPDEKEQIRLDAEMKQMMQSLPERKRRTFLRYVNKREEVKNDENGKRKDDKEIKDELIFKLNSLKVEDNCDFEEDEFYDDDDDDYESNEEN